MIRTVTRCAHCGALELDGLEVDVQRREVRWQGRVAVGLPVPVQALATIVIGRGAPVPVERIESALWSHRHDGGPEASYSAIKVAVSRARALLRAVAAPFEVRAIWGVGYRLYRIDGHGIEPATQPEMETADA